MNIEELEKLAATQRMVAKRLFGESIDRGGYLNDDLPMSRFVDAVINAAILEVTLAQAQASLHLPPNVKLRGSPASGRVPLECRVGRKDT
ncbi:MAG: hypothetical protein B7Y56_15875 [Gallionellales bacterium 35-53-114]|jgi:hypothetical protein|nr:MAG: hypothetical protein B7Y56_15875 [Gallionellales bacterium 35-53-114]HQS60022.1 hypothetical protein [Gallionellaceae bacterium]